LPQIEKDYISAGKVKYVVKDFPLEAIHKNAFKAAEATHCADEQGKFWEMSERLFANPQKLNPPDLLGYAEAVGMDASKFQQCLDSGKYAARVRKDMGDGQQAGVTGTPAFFLGVTDPKDGKIKALRTIKGAQQYAGFKEAIDGLLAEQK